MGGEESLLSSFMDHLKVGGIWGYRVTANGNGRSLIPRGESGIDVSLVVDSGALSEYVENVDSIWNDALWPVAEMPKRAWMILTLLIEEELGSDPSGITSISVTRLGVEAV